MDTGRNLRPRDKSVHRRTDRDTEHARDTSDSESLVDEPVSEPPPMSVKGFEAFLEAQTYFLQQQTELAHAGEKTRGSLSSAAETSQSNGRRGAATQGLTRSSDEGA